MFESHIPEDFCVTGIIILEEIVWLKLWIASVCVWDKSSSQGENSNLGSADVFNCILDSPLFTFSVYVQCLIHRCY